MKKTKEKASDSVFQVCMILLFALLFFICFYPFWYIFIVSISDSVESQRTVVSFLPVQPTLENYRQIFRLQGIWSAFGVSALRTVVGTIVTLFFTSIFAYTLTKQNLPFRKCFYRFAVISMYLNAGLIPWYLTMRNIGLKDSFWVYILPGAVGAYNMVLIKTYIESISPSLEESALIDGAGYLRIYAKIVMPICLPILAAVTVFSAIGQWNQWYDNLLLVNNNSLKTLQLTLLEYLRKTTNAANEAQSGLAGGVNIAPMTVRMTITMVATLPILIVYPAMQKYFIKGIMVGAVKG